MAAEGGHHIKSEQAKKLELVKEIHQLKIKIQNFEKEKATHIYNKHSEFFSEFTPLKELDQTMSKERSGEKVKLQQQLNGISNKVKKFHRELQNVKTTPEFLEKLKVIMEDVESHINILKEQQRQQYEELMREEKITNQEILALEKKFEMWAVQGATSARSTARTPKPVPIAANRDVTKDLPPEVAAFERFVEQSGGVRAGWDEYDHSTFMRYRIKHKGKPNFIRDLIPNLPTRSEQEVIEHERWYQQYLELNEEKKEAIQKWREKKQEEKEQVLAQAEEAQSDEEEEQKAREEEHRKRMEQEKQHRRMQLNRWKVDRELEKAQGEEMKLRRELEKTRKEEEAKKRQLEQKQRVEEYRKQKEEERMRKEAEEALREQVEEEIRREQQTDLAKFQERDMKAVKSKLSREREKQEQEKEKQKRLSRMKGRAEANVARDPNRLLQPTAGWIERQADQTKTSSGPVLHMPHRAVPTWRQGLH